MDEKCETLSIYEFCFYDLVHFLFTCMAILNVSAFSLDTAVIWLTTPVLNDFKPFSDTCNMIYIVGSRGASQLGGTF